MFRSVKEYRDAQKAREKDLKAEVERLVKKLVERGANRIILFGSLAQGRIGPWSDVDLLVIIPDEENSKEWRQWIYEDVERHVAIDVIVFTTSELHNNLPASSFLRHIIENGVTLYEGE